MMNDSIMLLSGQMGDICSSGVGELTCCSFVVCFYAYWLGSNGLK